MDNNLCFGAKIRKKMYPSFAILKWGSTGYICYGHVFLMRCRTATPLLGVIRLLGSAKSSPPLETYSYIMDFVSLHTDRHTPKISVQFSKQYERRNMSSFLMSLYESSKREIRKCHKIAIRQQNATWGLKHNYCVQSVFSYLTSM